MNHYKSYLQIGLFLLMVTLALVAQAPPAPAAGQEGQPPDPLESHDNIHAITGLILDPQAQPVVEAEVRVYVDREDTPAAEALSQEDGHFVIDIPLDLPHQSLYLEIERAHFEPYEYEARGEALTLLRRGRTIRVPDIVLERRVTPGFVFAALAFAGILALIAFEVLHNTTATLVGATAILAFSYLGSHLVSPDLFIFDFERAISYIDFDVIFLVMGMMIVVGILEGTGIFQWMAFMAYRLSRGRITVLMIILVVITSVASALLDNVTTMLLMAPISLQIALALGVSPYVLLIPEVLASNVGGISTLIGTPTNILIGSYAKIGFNDFLVNQTAGVIAALAVLVIFARWYYRRQYRAVGHGISPTLYARLEENAKINDPVKLRKSLIVFGVMLFFFLVGDAFHVQAVVTALIGATVFLVWVERDVERMLRAVDWTTLVFFMALFIAVGAIQEVGLVGMIAEALAAFIGDNQLLGLVVLVWASALVSTLIDNIPFAATMLPVVAFLSKTLDPHTSKYLFYGLSVGAAMGGNGSLIGSSPNVVTGGILERAGYKVTYVEWLRVGFPAMILTVAAGTIWLIVRFFVFGSV